MIHRENKFKLIIQIIDKNHPLYISSNHFEFYKKLLETKDQCMCTIYLDEYYDTLRKSEQFGKIKKILQIFITEKIKEFNINN